MAENVPETVLFVCFGAMSNVGMMSGLAVMVPAEEAIVHAIYGYREMAQP